jgi:hypothetical protein
MNFRVVFLVGQDNESPRQSIESVCALEGITPEGVPLESYPSLAIVVRSSLVTTPALLRMKLEGFKFPSVEDLCSAG